METALAEEISHAPVRLPRIGVFGGTFDPPHVGHLIITTELRFALSLDRVLFVPAGRPPHKAGQIVGDDAHRLAMLRLALVDAPEFEVSTVDLERHGPSYTADTLGLLQDRLGPAELVFLMGEDSLRDLPTWHEPNLIATRAGFGVARRPGVVVDLDLVFSAVPAARGRVHLVDVPEIDISSRDLRRRVANGQPIRFQVPRPVEEYIRDRRLYLETAPPEHAHERQATV
ncbi:MAG TPA: nicotinate-nucleotide adenylyltransferase [Thermomicrobiales bacterium]|jgi:nicotinate-nucleotide adenylyltransferase